MRLPLLLPLLVLAALTSNAQKAAQSDYVVTLAGDTLRGQVRQVGKHHQAVRLYRAGQAFTEFSAAEARGYGSTHGPEGISRTVGERGKPQFLVPLVQGYVSLFAGENEQQEKRYYLQVPDSAYVIEVARVTNQLTLARHLAGCPTLEFGSNEIQNRYPYSSKGLSEVVLAYNRCRQPQQPTQLVQRSSGARLSVGLKAGLNVSDFNLLPELVSASHGQVLGYQGGLTLNLATRTGFSVQVEAVYVALRSTYGPYEATSYNSGIPSNTHLSTVHYSQFQVPLLLRYTVGHGVFRPFLNAGVSYALNFSNTSAIGFPNSSSLADAPIAVAKSSYGFAAGGGVTIHRASLPVLSVEMRFDRMEDNNNRASYTQKHQSLRLDLGIAF